MTTTETPQPDTGAPYTRLPHVGYLEATFRLLVGERLRLGIPLEQVAKSTGLPERRLTGMENGNLGVSYPVVDRYANAIGSRLTFLIDRPTDPNDLVCCGSCHVPIPAHLL